MSDYTSSQQTPQETIASLRRHIEGLVRAAEPFLKAMEYHDSQAFQMARTITDRDLVQARRRDCMDLRAAITAIPAEMRGGQNERPY